MGYPAGFIKANAFTRKWEKGYVNHPNDPGGATWNGVSLRFLRDRGLDINGDGKIDVEDILTLWRNGDQAKVDEIFYRAFWLEPELDRLQALPLQAVVYDASVNCGCQRSAIFLQRACNCLLPPGERLREDGMIGPKTAAAANRYCGKTLASLALDRRLYFHNRLVANSPHRDGRDYRPFAAGWRNRVNALRQYIRELA